MGLLLRGCCVDSCYLSLFLSHKFYLSWCYHVSLPFLLFFYIKKALTNNYKLNSNVCFCFKFIYLIKKIDMNCWGHQEELNHKKHQQGDYWLSFYMVAEFLILERMLELLKCKNKHNFKKFNYINLFYYLTLLLIIIKRIMIIIINLLKSPISIFLSFRIISSSLLSM